jgi:hypothetical protein
MLRRRFGPKRHEVTVEWIRLHNLDLYVFLTKYHSGDQVKKTGMRRACSMNGGE